MANHCILFLTENIMNNEFNEDILITCGALPLPNHIIYKQLEKKFNILFMLH